MSIRFVAKVIGTLVSALPAVLYGPLYYRYLQRDKIEALKQARWAYEQLMTLSETGN